MNPPDPVEAARWLHQYGVFGVFYLVPVNERRIKGGAYRGSWLALSRALYFGKVKELLGHEESVKEYVRLRPSKSTACQSKEKKPSEILTRDNAKMTAHVDTGFRCCVMPRRNYENTG